MYKCPNCGELPHWNAVKLAGAAVPARGIGTGIRGGLNRSNENWEAYRAAVVSISGEICRAKVSRETTVVFKAADGRRFLRGLKDATDANLVNTAVALGAVAWTTLGTVEGGPDVVLNDIDYAPDGAKVRVVQRRLGVAHV